MALSIDRLPTVRIITGDGEQSDYLPQLVAAYREHGPIFKTIFRAGFQPVTMIGPAANRFLMLTHRQHFSNAKGWSFGSFFGNGLLNIDNPEWSRARKILNPAFTMTYLARYIPLVERIIAARSRNWLGRAAIDLFEEAKLITFDVVAETVAGYPAGEEVDHLRDLFDLRLHAFASFQETWAEFRKRMQPVEVELNAILHAQIARKRKAPSDDILSLLVQTRDENSVPMTTAQILGHLKILLVAGHETTTTLAAWLLYLLATHPAYAARVQQEIDAMLHATGDTVTLAAIKQMPVLGRAVTETGRMYSPVVNIPRGVVKPFEFGGYTIPAGTLVRCALAAGHRLPQFFDNPDTFDPDRFTPPREEDKRTPYSLVIFGGGPRTCIGLNLALIEAKTLAAHILSRYTLEPVMPQAPIQDSRGIVGRPYPGLKVGVYRRHGVQT